ncbi:ABC transporter ATP-binding protein, partial [bacterium]|nr:ABC transporter ATP-binding protein [bacterium]
GEITTRIVYDVGLLNSSFVLHFPRIIFQSFLAFLYMVIIFTIDWKLSAISILIFPPLLFPIFKIGKKLRKLGRKIQEMYGNVGNVINESIYGQKIIKAYNLQKPMVEKFRKENEGIFRTVLSITKRILIITPFTEIMGAIGASGLIYFGAKNVIEGRMSPGFLFLFFAALFSAISPMKGVGISFLNLKHASSALPRIFSVLDTEERVKDTGREIFSGIREKIEFKDVSFSYEDKKILDGINLTVKKGEKIGIVGPTGTGKTTLIGLLLRFYDPVDGEILIDGKNIKDFTLASLRHHIGFVPQEPILFRDTIRNNITFKSNEDDEKLRKIIEIVGLKEFIENLPDKLETVIGERGTTLSGGQKQLISVARAIYKDPEILILDEATASLDSESEKILQKALERVMEKRTVFIIAHRLSTLRNVDRIIVLKDGKIFEEGTHQQLYEKKGLYHKLWQIQFSE